MSKDDKQKLAKALRKHVGNINNGFKTLSVPNKDAYMIFMQTLHNFPVSSHFEKPCWKEVVQIGEKLGRDATAVGILYTGETPEAKVLEDKMNLYFSDLQHFMLVSYGSMVDAGPTLLSFVQKAVRQICDSSFMLFEEAVSAYANKTRKHSITQHVGVVLESCSALKKIPATNVTAIGRAMTQVSVSIKDVLREINELKPASSEQEDTPPDEDGYSSDEDLCNELSPEEMKIMRLTSGIISAILAVIQELIRSITAMFQQETSDNSVIPVDSLEKLLQLSQEIGVQVDELGACLYPPQEISAIKVILEKISRISDETEKEQVNVWGYKEDFGRGCNCLRSSLRQLRLELGCSGADDVIPKLQNLVVID